MRLLNSVKKIARSSFLIVIIAVYAALSLTTPTRALEDCTEDKLRDLGVTIVNCDGTSNEACAPLDSIQTIEAGSKVYLLGDSIMNAASTEVRERVTNSGYVVTAINADGGRAISSDTVGNQPTGLEAVANDSTIIAGSDVVVVELGTNSGGEDLNIQIPAQVDAIRATGFTGVLFWVNMFHGGDSATEKNTIIDSLSSPTEENFTVIDAKNAGIELKDDQTHPTAAGEVQFAETIASAIASYQVSSQSSGDTGGTGEFVAKPIVGGASLDGNPTHILSYLEGINEQQAAAAIDTYISTRKPDSPFVGLGSAFVAGAKKYNVNPFLPVGHLQKENGFATANGGWHDPDTTFATQAAATSQDASQKSPSYNAFGREGSSTQPRVYYKTSSGRIRTPFKWSDWSASLDGNNGTEDPWFALINRRYLANDTGSFKIASGDFATYISHYAPQGDGNNEADYVQGLKDAIDEMVQLMGSGVGFPPQQGACDEATAGANGWGLPGEDNSMIYYSQLVEANSPKDPSVTSYWGEYPYGEGTILECGCGPTSFAMVVATLKNDPTITPDIVAAWAAENGYRSGSEACSGSSWWWIDNPGPTLEKWGVASRQITIDEAPSLLKQGKLIIMSVGNGSPFLSEGGNGHLLVMRAVTNDGKFLFADPSDGNSKRLNGGDGGGEVDVNIFNGTPPGSSHTPVDASIVTQGLNGLFVVEVSQ